MASIGRKVIAYIRNLSDSGKELEILQELRKIPAVTEALMVYGEFDVVARAEFTMLIELDETIYAIRRVPGVIRTTTLISTP